MSLYAVTIQDVRCISQADLEIPPGLSLIWGENGSGKTSILESIFLLGRGRSFRTRNTERLIRHGHEHLRVIGEVEVPGGYRQVIGIEARRSGVTARVAGNPVDSLAELSRAFPVQVIEPGVHKLLEEGGYRRRRWMDWAVFHVEPQFVGVWQRYSRALKQRNAALKADPSQAGAWNAELARAGEQIAASRARLLEQLQPHWAYVLEALTGLDVQLHYLRGWAAERSLLEALEASRVRDESRGLTHAGPHRADVSVRLANRPAREVLSRGQQKLVAVAMTVAQIRLLRELTGTTPTLLLDDPAAELDGTRLRVFIEQVKQLRSQLILTSLTAESRLFGVPERTFHVAEGRVQPV
ncbi:MAG TPA: DNA replication/repair protein RecF [Steroidobacteraceae bacterium]|nr:DNA replication/repair protein RecF [Steroidobacteraceae bacterium]